jgi:hypothetical protein
MRVLQRFILFICLLLPTLVLATHGGGDNGGDFWVDGPAEVQPGVDRNIPDVSIDKFGRSIYVWYAFGSVGGDRNDVFLRRFDAAGEPLKDPVMVNTSTEDDQFFARVAVSEDGSFLVVWQSDEPDSEVNVDRKFVRSQAFDADANPVGSELLVNTLLTGEAVDISADVAALKGGGYVVVWRSRKSAGDDDWLGVQARLIGANGAALGAQFQANSLVGKSENYPAVTGLADGGFLVVWTTPEVHGRKFKADGTPVGDDFQINTFTTGAEAETDVVLGFGDQLLVVWKDSEENVEETEIRGRFFNQNLAAQGSDFRINTFTAGAQNHVKAGDYGSAGFFVVWESVGSAGSDVNAQSIQGRIVTGSDQFHGAQFQLNAWITGAQQLPGIGGRDGNIAIAWRSPGNVETDKAVIVGQIWSLCGIYCDGFE